MAGDRLAIVGPGLMGLGLAQTAAAAGLDVLLVGRDAAAAAAGRARLAGQLAQQVARGRRSAAEVDGLMARVRAVAGDAELATCQAAVECVPEDRALKRATLQRLEAVLPVSALIATNTSGLPVSGLATALQQPARFLGLHFFSPVERMALVEVVRGSATGEAALQAGLALVQRLGKTAVVVRDGPGFFTSRVFAAYLDEALALVGEGVPVAEVDAAALALGRTIGPLALLDELSLALNLQQIEQARADGLPPERCRPLGAPVLGAMVAAGRSGRRQGGGFYDRGPEGERQPWPGLATLFPLAVTPPAGAELQARLRLAESLEALRCLEEGVVASAADADTASRLGLAYPAAQGGVLATVERQGLAAFIAQADALAGAFGERFRPPPWLRRRASLDLEPSP